MFPYLSLFNVPYLSFTTLTYYSTRTSVALALSTGAQEWHIVSLLGDVTSPTTVAHYVSMTSHLRVLSTEKHWPPADSTQCTQTSVYSIWTKFIARHWTSMEGSLRHSSGWGTEAFPPQQRNLRTRSLEHRALQSPKRSATGWNQDTMNKGTPDIEFERDWSVVLGAIIADWQKMKNYLAFPGKIPETR